MCYGVAGKGTCFPPFFHQFSPSRLICSIPCCKPFPGAAVYSQKDTLSPHSLEHRLMLLPASEAILVYLITAWVDHDLKPGFVLKKTTHQRINPKSQRENAQFPADHLCKGCKNITPHVSNWISGTRWYTVITAPVQQQLLSSASMYWQEPLCGNQVGLIWGAEHSGNQEGLRKVLVMEKPRWKEGSCQPKLCLRGRMKGLFRTLFGVNSAFLQFLPIS